MALSDVKFVGAGPWGPGLGRVMTVPEFDGSLYALREAIQDLIDNPVEGVGISGMSISGRQWTIHLSDSSTLGPYTLPMATPRNRGVWAAAINYSAFDIVRVGGFGTYMVVQDHTSASTFDPYVSNSEGNFYIQIGPDPFFTPQTLDVPGATLTLNLSHQNKYLRSRNGSGLTATLNAGVYPMNAEIYFRQVNGPIVITAGTDVTLNLPSGMDAAATSSPGETFKLKRVPSATGEQWDVIPMGGGGSGGGGAGLAHVDIDSGPVVLDASHKNKVLMMHDLGLVEITLDPGIFAVDDEIYFRSLNTKAFITLGAGCQFTPGVYDDPGTYTDQYFKLKRVTDNAGDEVWDYIPLVMRWDNRYTLVGDADYTVALVDDGCLLNAIAAGGTDFLLPAFYYDGGEVRFRQGTTDPVTLTPDTGTSFEVKGGGAAETGGLGSVIHAKFVSGVWWVWGDLV